jgi:UDP-2,3-diacylglucosamine pyrophosphatase LpxH
MALVTSFESEPAHLWPRRAPPRREQPRTRRHRTLWISDIHLGSRGCKAERLCDFLRNNECDLLYLVGDIVDGWQLSQRWYWPESHKAVVNEILRMSQSGTRVIFIPGNHDDVFRDYIGLCFAGVELADEAIHETADGRRLLVLHGDRFDSAVTRVRWLAKAGDWAHSWAVRANDLVAAARRGLGMPYWSLSGWLKSHVKDAVAIGGRFEDALVQEVVRRGVDGVVCGHIHKAEIRQIGEIVYCNDGDWVDSCTALSEDDAGNLAIVAWKSPLGEIHARKLNFANAAE